MSMLEGHELAAGVEFGTHHGHAAGVGQMKQDGTGSTSADACTAVARRTQES